MELNRNNTDFPLAISKFVKDIKRNSKYDFLKYYQNIVREYVTSIKIDSRGLLIYHGTGVGKSILAIALAIDLINIRQPIMLMTKSLRTNMRNSIFKYVKLRKESDPDFYLCKLSDSALNEWVDNKFSFVSMNASNMLNQLHNAVERNATNEFDAALESKYHNITQIHLDGKLLIIDEAHNLFRSITNGSKNAVGVYESIMKAKDLKVIFLTGTPIATDPFELVPCFNMIGSTKEKNTLPEYYRDFKQLYVDGRKIKNKNFFQNRIFGLVSYVDRFTCPLGSTKSAINTNFPDELPIKIVKVTMSKDQYSMYQLARDKEIEEKNKPKMFNNEDFGMLKPKSPNASTYRVHSRQLSNYAPPSRNNTLGDLPDPPSLGVVQNYVNILESPKFKKILDNILLHEKQLGLVYSQFTGIGGLGVFARYLKANGWVQYGVDKSVNRMMETSNAPSVQSYVTAAYAYLDSIVGGDEIIRHNNNVNKSKYKKTKSTTPNFFKSKQEAIQKNKLPTFAVISGEICTEIREVIAKVYCSESNKHGDEIKLLLISSTGAEGLDLRNIRHIHIMEPYWNWSRIAQVIARGVRNDSHIMLPKEEQNVQPYIYLSIAPDQSVLSTTDTDLYDESVAEMELINEFLTAIKEVSIECTLHSENCRLCTPTNSTLYTDNPAYDIRNTDPCAPSVETEVNVKSIIIDNVTYYYTPDDNSIYDYNIYIEDKILGGHKKIQENDPLFARVLAEILKTQV